jgi:urocanate hydratase
LVKGFGLVLDGSLDADRRAESMLAWDVSNGVARRYILLIILNIFKNHNDAP